MKAIGRSIDDPIVIAFGKLLRLLELSAQLSLLRLLHKVERPLSRSDEFVGFWHALTSSHG